MKFKKVWLVVGLVTLSMSSLGSVHAMPKAQTQFSNSVVSSNTDTLNVSDIRYYTTLSDSRENEKERGLVEYKNAIELVNQQMQKDNIKLETDFDNVNYQQYVLSFATSFGLFSKEDMKEIVSFVKFMDLYENYGKNDKLSNYEIKLSQRQQLSTEEIVNVQELLPIQFNVQTTIDDGLTSIFSSDANEIEGSSINAVAAANGYNYITARDYAYTWWDGRNPVYSTYYAEDKGCDVTDTACWTLWNDCANFVSQALYAGGMSFKTGATYTSKYSWSFGPLVPTWTWGGANMFYQHWSDRAGVAAYVSDLQTGDAISLNTGGDADIDHTQIITKNTGNGTANKYLTQHSFNSKEGTTLSDMYSAGYGVYGYEIDKASN
ncbi:MAG: amidase domain-containing protein [Candidatus Pristimantibacillus sp.]